MTADAKQEPRRPWYADGLRFACQPECGACCVNHGDYAYVYVDEGDCRRLARHLGLPAAEFRRRYTELDDGEPVLRMDEEACPFLEGSRCSVYEARPTQCRTFPFWRENVKTRAAWNRLRGFCPGIDRGERVLLEIIRDHLAARD